MGWDRKRWGTLNMYKAPQCRRSNIRDRTIKWDRMLGAQINNLASIFRSGLV